MEDLLCPTGVWRFARGMAFALAAADREFDVAIQHLTEAYDLEQQLKYDEPESWPEPALLRLGTVLLEAGRAAEAEAAFRRDIIRHPNNPWSLFGLAQALRAQYKNAEAAETQRRFEIGWSRADVKLNGSRF